MMCRNWTIVAVVWTMVFCGIFTGCNKACEEGGVRQCKEIGKQLAQAVESKSVYDEPLELLKKNCKNESLPACEELGNAMQTFHDTLSWDEVNEIGVALAAVCLRNWNAASYDQKYAGFCDVVVQTFERGKNIQRLRNSGKNVLRQLCLTGKSVKACELRAEYGPLPKTTLTDVSTENLMEYTTLAIAGCTAGVKEYCELKSLYETEQKRRTDAVRIENERVQRNRKKISNGIQSGDLDCELWAGSSSRSSKFQMCEHLAATVRDGRTSSSARAYMERYLRDDLGIRRISAYMIADLGESFYECVMLSYNSYFSVHYPRGKHFILETSVTKYKSKGRFHAWVTRVGSREIQTKDGFYETWDIYKESEVGGLWGFVREASAGYQTSEAARDMLRILQ